LRTEMALGGELSARALLTDSEEGWVLSTAQLHAGKGELDGPGPAGLMTVSTDLPLLSFDEWLGWLQSHGLLQQGGGELPPLRLALQAEEMVVLDRPFNQFKLFGEQQEGGWQFKVESEQAAGQFEYDPSGYGAVQATFDRLWLAPALGRTALGKQTPSSVPELAVMVTDFQFRGWSLGQLQLQAERTETTLEIDQLVLEMGPAGRLQLQGQWLDGGDPTTHLYGTLETKNFGAAVALVGLGESLQQGKGVVDIDLSWAGSPTEFSATRLDGTVAVNLRKGVVSTVEPGLGRVIGLINLDAIKRRLRLKFGDVLEKGLAYDTLIGGYQIQGGRADTDALVLDGPAVRLAIAGRTDLGNETFDLKVVTQPKVESSLNTAVAVVSPIAGVAMFLGRKLLGKPIDRLAGHHYRVTGSWAEPVVESIKVPLLPAR